MNCYLFDFKAELQQPARNILDDCYRSPVYKDFTFYLYYDDTKLVHGNFFNVRACKSFMLDCKVWRLFEDFEKKEVWLLTY